MKLKKLLEVMEPSKTVMIYCQEGNSECVYYGTFMVEDCIDLPDWLLAQKVIDIDYSIDHNSFIVETVSH